MKCPVCGSDIDDVSLKCGCGHQFASDPRKLDSLSDRPELGGFEITAGIMGLMVVILGLLIRLLYHGMQE